MDKEIKEILEYFRKKVNDKIETYTVVDRDTIYLEQLLDYITNLQEELEEEKRIEEKSLETINNLQQKVNQYENPDDLTLFYMWLDEKAKDKMKALQEENEILKRDIKALQNHYNKIFNDANNRIDKAIEYIKENADYGIQEKCCVNDLNYDECDILLNILQGSDKK